MRFKQEKHLSGSAVAIGVVTKIVNNFVTLRNGSCKLLETKLCIVTIEQTSIFWKSGFPYRTPSYVFNTLLFSILYLLTATSSSRSRKLHEKFSKILLFNNFVASR